MCRRFAVILVLLATALGLSAHPNLQDAMWVQFEPELVRVAVNVSAKEISVAQQISTEAPELETAAAAHRDYVLSHLVVAIGEMPLVGQVVKLTPQPKTPEPETSFFQYEIEYPLGGRKPGEVSISHSMLREWPYAAGTPWNVTYVMRTKRSDSPDVRAWLLRSQEPVLVPTGWSATPAPAESDAWRTAREYLWHGFMHILTGYDHLLFVSALVIATVSFWEMVKVIFAFTLAHTLTLALSVFDLVRLPSSLVEPVIALSIVFVALQNLLRPGSVHTRSRLAVAFGFGLIHGLGFAGGLLDAMEGLPAIGLWIALAAFSLGVELGHQAVVLPLFGLLKAARQNSGEASHARILRYGSLLIAVCGAYYLVVSVKEQWL